LDISLTEIQQWALAGLAATHNIEVVEYVDRGEEEQSKAFSEGAAAYADDLPLEANPYPALSDEHADWFLGWKEADEEDF